MTKSLRNRLGWLLVTIVVLITAYNSDGYYHADEHYQIISPAMYLHGDLTLDQLPWEFKEMIRPSVQPMLFAGFIEIGSWLNWDGFAIARFSRVLTALLMLLLIFHFQSNDYPHLHWLLLIWFVPVLLCRFSSENWSGMIFMAALALNRSKYSSPLLIGICFGLAFSMRFQIAIMVIPILALWGIKRVFTLKQLAVITFGGVLSLLVLILSDFILYGELIFTPYNYLKVNLIDGVASERYGESGPLFYLLGILKKSYFIPGLLVLFGFIYYLKKHPSGELGIAVIAFLIVHHFIGHKEVRFLFPLLIPMMLIMHHMLHSNRIWQKVTMVVIIVFFPVGLFTMSRPIKHEVAALELVHQLEEPMYFISNSPFYPIHLGLELYQPIPQRIFPLNDQTLNSGDLVYADRRDVLNMQCEPLYQEVPEWIVQNFNYFGWAERTTIYGVYRIH